MSTNKKTRPEVGKAAPAFYLPASDDTKLRLSSLKGRPVVVYFYPRDDTPGCTIEAQAFRDVQAELLALDAVVLGISPDTADSHCKFIDKYALNFLLLSDEDHAVAEKYGVWVEKNNYGKKYMGIQRATFVVDRKGKIAHVWPKVKPDGHAQEVVEALKGLG
jgi:thioredoxin-dependent peroxiredoxin